MKKLLHESVFNFIEENGSGKMYNVNLFLKVYFIFILLILSSCSLREDPDKHLVEILNVSSEFSHSVQEELPGYKSLELPYKKVKGQEVPIPELRYWRGVRRLFFVPEDNLKTQDFSGFSIHTMLFYNRRRALTVFNSFCHDSMWRENKLLGDKSRIYLIHNSVLYLNQEEGLNPNVWSAVLKIMDSQLETFETARACVCLKH